VPARVSAPATIDFGTVVVNAIAQVSISIGNGASLALWSKDGTGRGIDTLNYSLAASSGFMAAAGPFADAAGGGLDSHVVSMNTSSPGVKTGTLTIASDDPDTPSLMIAISGTVQANPDYDVNNDGLVNIEDLHAWHAAATDVDGNGGVDAADAVALRVHLREGEVADTTVGR
jgi:hypothetical protein